jgi:hypothetical protein
MVTGLVKDNDFEYNFALNILFHLKIYISHSIDHLHISDLILKLHVYVSKELFLFKAGKRVPFMKSSMKITFYSPKYFQHFNVVTEKKDLHCKKFTETSHLIL